MARVIAPLGTNIKNDKLEEMRQVAQRIATPGKGILASDETTAGLGAKFATISLENTKQNRQRYREMVYTTPGLNQYISAAIFNSETFNEFKISKTGQRFVDYLRNQGILVGIKADQGVRNLPYKPNEQYVPMIDNLLEKAGEYYRQGASFAKLRVPFWIQNGYI
eukprot:232404_1